MAISFKDKAYFVIFFGLLIIPILIFPQMALAENISKGLTLSPLRSELEVAPGTSVEGILKVTNSTAAAMTVNFSAEEFNVINQQYDYAFTAKSDTAKWILFDSTELMLGVGDSQDVSFRIGAPLSAEPGGRYISLFASTDTNSADITVNSRQRVASLLYINVAGDVTRSGQLLSLDSPWFVDGHSKWSMVLRNSGTTHFRSRYKSSVQNIIGGKIITEKSGDALILPGTVRAISDETILPKIPGLYKIVYTIGLGDTPSKTEVRYMIYLSPIVIIFIVVIITILLFCLIKNLKKRKKNV